MLDLHRKYSEYFSLVRTLREQLLPTGKVYLLDDYLDGLYSCRETDHYADFDEQIEGPLIDLHRKCMAILSGNQLGSDTWFSRLMRAYVQAHPLDEFTRNTQCRIYCWVLFPTYYQYLLETMEDTSEYQLVYGQQYELLCDLLGKRAMRRLARRFDACFGGVCGNQLLLRASCDRLMNRLMETTDTDQRLHELFLDRPELLDYPWIDAYMEAHDLLSNT
ncbi:MAG: hypothetical protein Q4E13_09045 [Clostridia bacterium]|nr:hypothetical protein [Clostridia bacterium]